MKDDVPANKYFTGFHVIHLPALLGKGIPYEDALPTSRIKFIFRLLIVTSIAQAAKHFDMIIGW